MKNERIDKVSPGILVRLVTVLAVCKALVFEGVADTVHPVLYFHVSGAVRTGEPMGLAQVLDTLRLLCDVPAHAL